MTVVAVVADDHALFRHAVASLLKKECGVREVIEAESFDQTTICLKERGDASLAVLDLFMPGLNSASKMRAIRQGFPHVRIVVLTGSTNRQDILDALAAGVHGFVRKTASPQEIRSAISQVIAGGIYLPPETALYVDKSLSKYTEVSQDRLRRLTPRQCEIVHHLRSGSSNKQIARELGLAENTVKVHLNAVFRTLGVRDRRQISDVVSSWHSDEGKSSSEDCV